MATTLYALQLGKKSLYTWRRGFFSNALMIKNLMCALFSLCREGKIIHRREKAVFHPVSQAYTYLTRSEARISSPVAATVHYGTGKHWDELCHAAFSRTYVYGKKITGYEFEKKARKQNILFPPPPLPSKSCQPYGPEFSV